MLLVLVVVGGGGVVVGVVVLLLLLLLIDVCVLHLLFVKLLLRCCTRAITSEPKHTR